MITWEEHNRLCQRGDLSALLQLIGSETVPLERDILYISSINMTYRDQEEVCLALGRQYIEEFRRQPNPFGPGRLPDNLVVKRICRLLEFESPEEAIQVCEFAIELGLTDGTKGGFEGRIKRLRKKLTTGST